MKHKASLMALCGILSALAVVVMLLGSVVPFATFTCPILAMVLLIPIAAECSLTMGLTLYVSISILSLLLVPDKEIAFLFLFLGYYPILRPRLAAVKPAWLRLGVKLLIFNGAILAMYSLLLYVFVLESVAEEVGSGGFTVLLLLLGNVLFLLLDTLLYRFTRLYEIKWRRRLLH